MVIQMTCFWTICLLFLRLSIVCCEEIHDREYLVHYHGYWNEWKRSAFFTGAMLFYRTFEWARTPKHPLLQTIPSDFDTLTIYNSFRVDSILSHLRNSSFVRAISPHTLIRRELLMNEGADDARNTGQRVLLGVKETKIVSLLKAEVLHNLGYLGQGVRVGIFDTGLSRDHPHFHQHHVRERINWTNEPTVDDSMGHGTFVASMVGGKLTSPCPGLAPQADLYIFRVFTNAQLSYTSWFLDAFNYAMAKRLHIINLSIGGPDFTDGPFVEKVYELSANGIVMVSAIGNDGPLYGTLNNPADHMEVIGVGGMDYDERIARFSSRGMTTWELPSGYGRVKPDVVTFASTVWGSAINGDCRTLSGTTVASAVTAGAVTLLYSAVLHRGAVINPGSMKQAIIASARRLEFNGANIFEQGFGAMDLIGAYQVLKTYEPQASLSPSSLDLTQCPYMWPYCLQPLYYSARPVVFNITIHNGMGVTGQVSTAPQWHVYQDSAVSRGSPLQVSFTYSRELWPWSGYLAVHMTVTEAAAHFTGVVEGFVSLSVTSPPLPGEVGVGQRTSHLTLPVKVKIEPMPPRTKRLLWDQFHNLRYPPGYFPRDDLRATTSPLDWNGDHPHTNFKGLFEHLHRRGFRLEVLGEPLTCFNASLYSALIITDPEEEFHPSEVRKLHDDVTQHGLNLIVFADWFNLTVMNKIKFFDENTRQWWTPQTGGSNIPALNTLLEPYGVELGSRVFEGRFAIANLAMHYQSGTHLTRFPSGASSNVLYRTLFDAGDWVMSLPTPTHGHTNMPLPRSKNEAAPHIREQSDVPILGVTLTTHGHQTGGHLIVYGDSNCLDNSFLGTECYWLLDALLDYTRRGTLPQPLSDEMRPWVAPQSPDMLQPPSRPANSHFQLHSQLVTAFQDNLPLFGTLPMCAHISPSPSILELGPPPPDAYSRTTLRRMSSEALQAEWDAYKLALRPEKESEAQVVPLHPLGRLSSEGGQHPYVLLLLFGAAAFLIMGLILRQLVRSGRRGRHGATFSRSGNAVRLKRIVFEHYQG